jgi:Domain of unknown function (DUF4922)
MSWERRLVSDDELSSFLSRQTALDFNSRVRALITQQQKTWALLRDAIAGLDEVEYKMFTIKDSHVLAQFNPNRIVSTTANIEEDTIKQRPCFLCIENLPQEERGISFGDKLIVLCNPFPVLRDHLVITAREHVPQIIDGNLGLLLDLARELGDEWFALYNGPKCGASAPDHLHFQACSSEVLPIIREIDSWDRRTILKTDEIESFTLRSYRINVMVARGEKREVLLSCLDGMIKRLAELTGTPEEPMINLIVTFDGGRWTVTLFPRSKHRASSYYAEDESKLTVSPAAIDLSGVLVVPRADHFARISADDIEKIFAEVTFDEKQKRDYETNEK